MSRALDPLQFLPVTLALGFELLYILTIVQPQLFVFLTLGVSFTYVFLYIDLWSCWIGRVDIIPCGVSMCIYSHYVARIDTFCKAKFALIEALVTACS